MLRAGRYAPHKSISDNVTALRELRFVVSLESGDLICYVLKWLGAEGMSDRKALSGMLLHKTNTILGHLSPGVYWSLLTGV